MRWKLPWPKLAAVSAEDTAADEQPDGWQRHVEALQQAGIPEPGAAVQGRKPATVADEQALYDVAPSFVELLPWVEFLPESKSMLLEDGQSVAAFYELVPLGTEGREPGWLAHARDALENALQDSFDELDENPWVLQLYAQDEPSFDQYMQTLRDYVQPRARGSAFTEFYLRFFGHHLRAVAKPGGLFEDTVVTRLRWRGQTRRVRMVVYRRASGQGQANRRGQTPEQMLGIVCDRLCGGLANAGIQAGAWSRPTSTTGCCGGSTRAPRCSGLGWRTGSASTRWRAIRTVPRKARPARSSWRAGGISASGCSLGSRARTWRKGPGTSTACRTAC